MTASLHADALVVCALFDEYQALLSVTDDIVAPGWVQETSSKGLLTARATFLGDKKDPIRIIATFASSMGREAAAVIALGLMDEFPASCLAMTGICAGRRGKVALGDVIFADRLYSYDAGKVTVIDGVGKFQGDQYQSAPDTRWVQRMIAVSKLPQPDWVNERPGPTYERQEDWVLRHLAENRIPSKEPGFNQECPDWADVIPRLYQKKWLVPELSLTEEGRKHVNEQTLLYPNGPKSEDPFTVHVAPIATGAAVVEDAGIFPRLADSMRKVLGIDMESSALGHVASFRDIPVIVVKAVSDFGDTFKDDRYRSFAAKASAEYLLRLLKISTDLLPSVVSQHQSTTSPAKEELPMELIGTLADCYPEVGLARAVWERAGGKGSEVENNSQPRNLWQRIWMHSVRGAAVKPGSLLRVVASDWPHNDVIQKYLAIWSNT